MTSRIISSVLLLSGLAQASGNIRLYNGQDRDQSPPERFTGELTYVDMDSKKISSREQWVDGEREGPYVEYDHRTGAITDSGTYHHGKYHGVRRHYGDDGVIQQEYAYANGKLEGVQKSYRDGLVSRVYLMVPGKNLPDTEFQLNKKGQPTTLSCGTRTISKQDAEWCGMNGKQSTVTLYDEKGRVAATEQYLWGKLHGMSRKFHLATGEVLNEEKYDHGARQKDGEKVFKDGELLVKTDCDDSRDRCTETEFFEGSGHEVKTVSVWKKGLLVERTTRYQNGKVREAMTTEKDHLHIVHYDDEGLKESDGLYITAPSWSWMEYVPDGTLESFFDGKLRRREQYKAGQLDGKSETFWLSGTGEKVRYESTYAKSKLLKQKVFVNDRLAGELEYKPDGSLKSRKEYDLPKGVEI